MGWSELQEFIQQNQDRNQRMLEEDIRREREQEEARQQERRQQMEQEGVQLLDEHANEFVGVPGHNRVDITD